MIKGKFYTGLPNQMMNRARTNVNRQETNFFWPDESDMESVSARSKRIPSKAVSPIPNNNYESSQSPDIKPKELFRKQLSSGIEFYDNVNAKTPESRRRRFKKIDNVNLNCNDGHYQPERKKLETFSSKIEFYDFDNETEVKNARNKSNERPIKPLKKDEDVRVEEIKTKVESPEVNKKRITFRTEDKTKGILKRSDDKSTAEKVVVKPLPKRGLLPKNLSKSVENISKLAKNVIDDDKINKEPEKLSTIIKEVKKLNLTQDDKRNYDRYEPERDEIDYRYSSSRTSYDRNSRRNDLERDHSPRFSSDRYESRNGYKDDRDHRRFDSEEKNYRNSNRYEDFDGRRERAQNDRYERSGRDFYSQPREIYEERRYSERSRRFDESPPRGRNTPEYGRRRYNDEFKDDSRKDVHVQEVKKTQIQRKPIEPYYEKPSQIVHSEKAYSTSTSTNRTTKQLPQHLRTNILFNGNVRPQTQRPLTVRDSAVTRVGVGLPDIE